MMCTSKYRDTSIGYGEREGLEGIKGRERICMQSFSVCLLEQVGKEDLSLVGGADDHPNHAPVCRQKQRSVKGKQKNPARSPVVGGYEDWSGPA